MDIDELKDFNLGGGSALAMQIGHRYSYDLDFFGTSKLSIEDILLTIHNYFRYQEMHRTQNIAVLNVEGIKVDFVKYSYPIIGKIRQGNGIRLLSIEDIAAMKLDAIKGRGRKRDFYDLYFLLQRFNLPNLFELHLRKFRQDTRFLILKSLIYFEDAENDAPVRLMEESVNWEEVKKFILDQVDKL